MTDETRLGLWVSTQPAADGTYIASLEIGDDLSIPLTRDSAIRHAMTVLTAVQYAEYDAAVINQITGALKMPVEAAVEVVASLRDDRPPLDDAGTAPLLLAPGVNSKREPFISLWLRGRQIGQLDLDSARQHATHVLQVNIAADLDGAYHRWLRGTVGIDDPRTRAFVGDLIDWRTPHSDTRQENPDD